MKFALITGATKGIGKAIAEGLLKQGYHLILNFANDEITAGNLYNKLSGQFPGKVNLVQQDLGEIENIGAFFNKIVAITDELDVIIFNVGKTDRVKPPDITYENWKSVFDANVTVPFFLIQKFLPLIRPKGSILFIGSAMGIHPHSLSLSYGVSKAAVHALVKNMVKFLSQYKIRINAIVPGFVDTDWQVSKPKEIRESIEGKIALGRFSEPEEIAHASIFLIDNQYVNGELLVIDGGYSFK